MKIFLIILFSFLIFCNCSFGETYFVNSETGSDDSSGTTTITPFQSMTEARSHIAGGDTLYMHGWWEDYQLVLPPYGSYGDRTAFISWDGTADTNIAVGEAHLISGTRAFGWSNVSGNIYKCYLQLTAGVENTNTTAYMAIQIDSVNNDTAFLAEQTILGSLSEGQFCHQNDTLYIWLHEEFSSYDPDDFTIYAANKIGVFSGDGTAPQSGFVTLYGLDIRYWGSKGICMGHEDFHNDSVFIDYCKVHYGGRTGSNNAAAIASMRLTGSPDTSDYGHWNRIYACSLSNVYGTAADHRNGVTFYCESYYDFDNNWVYGASAGMDDKGGWDYASQRQGGKRRFNRIIQCVNGILADQVPMNDSVYGNTIISDSNTATGICYDFHNTGTPLGCPLYIFNNTILLRGTASTVYGVVFSREGSDPNATDSIFLKYNVVYAGNGSARGIMCAYGTEDSLLSDSNYFYPTMTFRVDTGNYVGFSTWQSTYGHDTHSSNTTNPYFVDTSLASLDLTPVDIDAFTTPLNYGGINWNVAGAWQLDDTTIVHSLSIYFVTDSSVRTIDNYSNVNAGDIDSTIAIIDSDNDLSNGYVLSQNKTSGINDPDTIIIATGLSPNTQYYLYRIVDTSGVKDTSSYLLFTTQSGNISHSLSEEDSSLNSITVSDDYSGYGSAVIDTIMLFVGTDTAITNASDSSKVSSSILDPHSITISGLADSTLFYYHFVTDFYGTRDTSQVDSIHTTYTITGEGGTDTFYIAAGTDDIKVVNTTVETGSSPAVIGYASGGYLCDYAARFSGITIPTGATITNSIVQFRASATSAITTVNARIYMEKNATPDYFSTVYSEYSSRALTTNYVDWNNIEAWTSGSDYQSPNFSTVFQEISDAYTLNNSYVVVMFKNNSSTLTADRRLLTYEGATPPMLIVTYTTEEGETIMVHRRGEIVKRLLSE